MSEEPVIHLEQSLASTKALLDRDRITVGPKGGLKESLGKPPISLVPAELVLGAARAFAFGVAKYSRHNWRKGITRGELYDALQRHLLDYVEGIDSADDSGLLHLDHAAACLGMLMQTCKDNLSPDDRHNKQKPELTQEQPVYVGGRRYD